MKIKFRNTAVLMLVMPILATTIPLVLNKPAQADNDRPYGVDTCKQGYVWREAQANDRVCVTPAVRARTRNENNLAASRREPNGGAYGPNTCKQGYVWREATASDPVCVPPEVRAQVAADNGQATERRVPAPLSETIVDRVSRPSIANGTIYGQFKWTGAAVPTSTRCQDLQVSLTSYKESTRPINLDQSQIFIPEPLFKYNKKLSTVPAGIRAYAGSAGTPGTCYYKVTADKQHIGEGAKLNFTRGSDCAARIKNEAVSIPGQTTELNHDVEFYCAPVIN